MYLREAKRDETVFNLQIMKLGHISKLWRNSTGQLVTMQIPKVLTNLFQETKFEKFIIMEREIHA